MKWIIKDYDGWMFEISDIDDVKTLRVGDENGWVDNTYPFHHADVVEGILRFYDEFDTMLFDIVMNEMNVDTLVIRD